jgi:hypothetical protein
MLLFEPEAVKRAAVIGRRLQASFPGFCLKLLQGSFGILEVNSSESGKVE